VSELRLFACRRENPKTGEVAVFLGQGTTEAEADKEGWENACEDYGKSSSGAPPIAKARLRVVLPDGRTVLRHPKAFLSGPYDPREFIPHPGTAAAEERMQKRLAAISCQQ
jgi:hypothetical protein